MKEVGFFALASVLFIVLGIFSFAQVPPPPPPAPGMEGDTLPPEPPEPGVTQTYGNGVIEGTEVCDGSNLNGKTCVTQGFSSGTLSCTSPGIFVTSGCVLASTPPQQQTNFEQPTINQENQKNSLEATKEESNLLLYSGIAMGALIFAGISLFFLRKLKKPSITQTVQPQIDTGVLQLVNYFKQNLTLGYTKEQIIQALQQRGYSQQIIDEALKYV